MAVSELLRNKLIIAYRMRPVYASLLACLLSSDVVPYVTLQSYLKRHEGSPDESAELALKVVVSRMRKSRPFKDGGYAMHNATKVGYYLDPETKRKIFDDIKEVANGYTTLA